MAGAEAYTLPASKVRKPLLQGDFSNLCGLYAIVNALQLALPSRISLKGNELSDFFLNGITFLHRHRQLHKVIAGGMEPTIWHELLDYLVARANARHRLQLRCVRVLRGVKRQDRHGAFAAVIRHLRRGHPVLVTMWDAYDHTTVLCGYSSARLILYDSYGFRWVKRDSCSFAHDGTHNRHRITRRSVIALVPAPPGKSDSNPFNQSV